MATEVPLRRQGEAPGAHGVSGGHSGPGRNRREDALDPPHLVADTLRWTQNLGHAAIDGIREFIRAADDREPAEVGKGHGRRIRAGTSDFATGSNQSRLKAASSAGGRRAQRRPPANCLLADLVARLLDDVRVELFALGFNGFHAARSHNGARAEVVHSRQTVGEGFPVDCMG